MRVKILQADTRPIHVAATSRNLSYGASNHFEIDTVLRENNGQLVFPQDTVTMGVLVNLVKCKAVGFEYEYYKGDPAKYIIGHYLFTPNLNDPRRHCTWIKIDALTEAFASEKNKGVDLFCMMDTDAWIRDELAFKEALATFLASDRVIAMPRDLDMPGSTHLNSGLVIVKNTAEGKELIRQIHEDPAYAYYYQTGIVEQSALNKLYEVNKEKWMVLPLADFNTPCGRIIRHCWMKHINDMMIRDELHATFARLCMSFVNDTTYDIRSGLVLLRD